MIEKSALFYKAKDAEEEIWRQIFMADFANGKRLATNTPHLSFSDSLLVSLIPRSCFPDILFLSPFPWGMTGARVRTPVLSFFPLAPLGLLCRRVHPLLKFSSPTVAEQPFRRVPVNIASSVIHRDVLQY